MSEVPLKPSHVCRKNEVSEALHPVFGVGPHRTDASLAR